MASTDPQLQSQPDQGGIGWLVNTTRQQVVNFKADRASGMETWVSIRTYHYDPPRPPEPISQRRVLRQHAIETWTVMLKSGWRPCRAPAR